MGCTAELRLFVAFFGLATLLPNGNSFVNAYEYCNHKMSELCGDFNHFMCDKESAVPKSGILLAHVPITNKIRRMLLEYHNKIRDVVAGGASYSKSWNINSSKKLSSDDDAAAANDDSAYKGDEKEGSNANSQGGKDPKTDEENSNANSQGEISPKADEESSNANSQGGKDPKDSNDGVVSVERRKKIKKLSIFNRNTERQTLGTQVNSAQILTETEYQQNNRKYLRTLNDSTLPTNNLSDSASPLNVTSTTGTIKRLKVTVNGQEIDENNINRIKIYGERENYTPEKPRSVRDTDKFLQIRKLYPIASRMRQLIWDYELAYIAYEHAGQCNHKSDKCRNTHRFLRVGENLEVITSPTKRKIIPTLEIMFASWYKEKESIHDPNQLVLGKAIDYNNASHLIRIINDKAARVGCSMAYCTDCELQGKVNFGEHCYFLTCLYDSDIEDGEALYKSTEGEPGSDCKYWNEGISTEYSNLCTNSNIMPQQV